MKIKIKRLNDLATIPVKGSQFAAGFDITVSEIPASQTLLSYKLLPGEYVLVRCGFSMEIPEGYEAQIRPRSGLAANHGITVLNAPGTIDADYRGEVGVIVVNHGRVEFPIRAGDRIAQMVIAPVLDVEMVEGELSDTKRGSGGFGSTGI